MGLLGYPCKSQLIIFKAQKSLAIISDWVIYIQTVKAISEFQMVAQTVDPAMKPMKKRRRMTEPTRPREPMMRVPVFREMHAQQFGSFPRATIFQQMFASFFVG